MQSLSSPFPRELISEEIARHLDDPSRASLFFAFKIKGGNYKITSFPYKCFNYSFRFVRMFKTFLDTLTTDFVCRCAALNGNLLLLDWAFKNGYTYSKSYHIPDPVPELVATAGYFRVLRWLYRKKHVILNSTIYAAALKSGNQRLINWIENLCPKLQIQSNPKPIVNDFMIWPKIMNPDLGIENDIEEIQDLAEEHLEQFVLVHSKVH